MNIALIMMHRDEDQLFWPWIRFHGSRYGYENCYVFDNGSTHPLVLDQLSKAEELGVNINYQYNTVSDYGIKNEIVLEQIRALRRQERYSVYFPIDCDEFLVFWNGADVVLSGEQVLRHIEEKYKNGDYYFRLSTRFMNSLLKRDQFYHSPMKKVAILADTKSGNPGHGFHMKGLRDRYIIPTQLTYIEFHNRPHVQYLEAAKRKLAPFISEFSEETLRNYKGLGHHLTKYCLMDEEHYLRNKHKNKKMVDIGMSAEFAELNVKYPYFEEGNDNPT